MAAFMTTCRRCRAEYTATRSDSIYCSGACRAAAFRENRAAKLLDVMRRMQAATLTAIDRGEHPDLSAIEAEALALLP